jgi:threonyl-tRNA synthetase
MSAMTPLEELRHSCAHVLASAVLRLFPEAQLDIGPPTKDGFYYDIDLDRSLTAEDLERIEAEMRRIIKENQRFERFELPRGEAEELLRRIGQDRYKPGRLADIPEGEPVSFYRNGEFTDLCAGTHVDYTKRIKAFKLLNVAGAYHRGDEANKQLQRIYGTAFPSKEELADHLHRLEEARARDHRKIGREMNLFRIDEEVGPGLVLWTPAGAVVRRELEDFISAKLARQGYRQVFTPHIGKLGLFRTSGHFPYYRESQFPPLLDHEEMDRLAHEGCSCAELSNRLADGDAEGFLLKPMNCPMHIRIFDGEPHSYRDLPVRLAEFGTVYRWEQSGELNGLTRVRGFTQDDAHIFCTPEQLDDEIRGCLSLVREVFVALGMKDYRVRVGLRDPESDKYTGSDENWEKAESALKQAVRGMDVEYSEEPGEAAFYGPKIDFVVEDVIGREWQLGTVQVDYNLPERFDLSYIGSDNRKHRPVMIHRAPFGSLERFTGVLVEHFAGNFPTWLAPEQVRLLPMNDDLAAYSAEIAARLRGDGFRVEEDLHPDKLGAKIRRGETDKVPHMLVLGQREREEGKVSLRSRIRPDAPESLSVDGFAAWLAEEVSSRRLPAARER